MRTRKLHNRLQLLMGTCVVLLAINTVLLGIVVHRGTVGPPAAPQSAAFSASAAGGRAGSSGTGPAREKTPESSPRAAALAAELAPGEDDVSSFFAHTLEPLAAAALDHEVAPSQVLPGAEAIAAAVETGSLQSPASTEVLTALEAGYERFNMPFPDLRIDPLSEPDTPGTTGSEASTAPGPSNGGTSAQVEADILRAYFSVTRDRLERAARMKDRDASAWLPAESTVQTAVESGNLESEASQEVLQKLRTGYEALGMSFPEPLMGG